MTSANRGEMNDLNAHIHHALASQAHRFLENYGFSTFTSATIRQLPLRDTNPSRD